MVQALEIRPLAIGRESALNIIGNSFGFHVIESDPKGNSRPLDDAELAVLYGTLQKLGESWYGGFRSKPINFWIDKNPGGGGYNDGWIRIGEPGGDPSILYRILLHEGTHASNEYRGWMYENEWCQRPGLDWRKNGETWTHPRIQDGQHESGEWESLPTDTRDVSIHPAEDLAEMVRYYVHSVRAERAYLWPLDLEKPAVYLWDTSPTRHVFVRDVFLKLPSDHAWYKPLHPVLERHARQNLGL
jgi:hypothetical protein